MERITLSHGDGGLLTKKLIEDVFLKLYNREELTADLGDAAFLTLNKTSIAMTTDTFVVNPLFFPGGDIGKLAIAGTVNDLAVSGAQPLFLTTGFIIEEGFPVKDLERVVQSMLEESLRAKVKIVAGDTKVVEKNKGDGLFINTTGIGVLTNNYKSEYSKINHGDVVLINGPIGLHGLTVLTQREEMSLELGIESDVCILNNLIHNLLKEFGAEVKFMRDPTRGGLATTLKEIADSRGLDIIIQEESIPINNEVQGGCDLLGLDPLYLANEGKVIIIVSAKVSEKVLEFLRKEPLGKDSKKIGYVNERHNINSSKVFVKNNYGGTRELNYLAGVQLPRIC